MRRTRAAERKAPRRWIDALWQAGAGCLSWQVLHEFYVNAVRKLKTPSPAARQLVETYALWQPVENSVGLIRRAWDWTDAAQLPYWDALIVGAAERAGCGWLLSEDFQTGRRLGEVATVDTPCW